MTLKIQWSVIASLFLVLLTAASADTIKLKNGQPLEGIIKKVENGKVTVQVGAETRTVDILQVESMNFDTPHLSDNADAGELTALMKDKDAQSLMRLSLALKLARQDLRSQLDQIEKDWKTGQPVSRDQARRWEGAKESFQVPMKRYEAILRSMYLDVLARIDDYNAFATEADKVYVGVKGLFSVGSPLLSDEQKEIAAKKVVPKAWYDKIFFDGYSRGYKEGSAFERLTIAPPAQGNADR